MTRSVEIRFLDSAAVSSLVDAGEIHAAVRAAFLAHGRGETQMPPKIYLDFPTGDLRTMPAYLPSLGAGGTAGVKLINVHPNNAARELPSVIGLIVLYDTETGVPTDLMDGTILTALRTGAAAAVADDLLAPPGASRLGVFGAGAQTPAQVKMCALVRPIREVLLYDIDAVRARARAEEIARETGLSVRAAPAEETAACEIVKTVTPARSAFLRREWIRPGTHIDAVGADAPGKQEVEIDLVAAARVFVDDWRQASHSGEIQHAVRAGRLRKEEATEIGTILAAGAPGRANDDEITLFDTTGLAIFDVAAAAEIAKKARARGEGTLLRLF